MPTEPGLASCALIINPSRYPQYVKILRQFLKRYPIPEVVETESREHFIQCVKDFYGGDKRYLLVWGGDGTAHNAINALMEAEGNGGSGLNKAVGFLRGGSGNGIQDSYEVPFSILKQLESYAESMRNHYAVDVDLLRVDEGNAGVYGQLIGVGFDVDVLKLRDTQRDAGRKKGHVKAGLMNYAAAAAKTFLTNDFETKESYHLRLKDGKYSFKGTRVNAEFPFQTLEREVRPRILEAGTRPYYGKLFKICPDVVCNDGYLDLYLFNFDDKLSMLRNLVSLWNGWHHKINKRFARKNKPLIERYEIKEMEILSERPFHYHVDGELKTVTQSTAEGYRLTISVAPQTISFLVPETFYRKFHPFDAE